MIGFTTSGERQLMGKNPASRVAAKRQINIYGYKEWYLFTPDVDIFLDGNHFGKVQYKGSTTVELDNENHYFEFQWNMGLGFVRKCHCFVNKTFVGGLQLVTHRVTSRISVEYTM